LSKQQLQILLFLKNVRRQNTRRVSRSDDADLVRSGRHNAVSRHCITRTGYGSAASESSRKPSELRQRRAHISTPTAACGASGLCALSLTRDNPGNYCADSKRFLDAQGTLFQTASGSRGVRTLSSAMVAFDQLVHAGEHDGGKIDNRLVVARPTNSASSSYVVFSQW